LSRDLIASNAEIRADAWAGAPDAGRFVGVLARDKPRILVEGSSRCRRGRAERQSALGQAGRGVLLVNSAHPEQLHQQRLRAEKMRSERRNRAGGGVLAALE